MPTPKDPRCQYLDSNPSKSEDEILTCKHQYTRGALRGKFCGKIFSGRTKSYGGYCSDHRRLINHQLTQCIGMSRCGENPDKTPGAAKYLYERCTNLVTTSLMRCQLHRANDTSKYRAKNKNYIASCLEKTLETVERKKEIVEDLEFLHSFNL